MLSTDKVKHCPKTFLFIIFFFMWGHKNPKHLIEAKCGFQFCVHLFGFLCMEFVVAFLHFISGVWLSLCALYVPFSLSPTCIFLMPMIYHYYWQLTPHFVHFACKLQLSTSNLISFDYH